MIESGFVRIGYHIYSIAFECWSIGFIVVETDLLHFVDLEDIRVPESCHGLFEIPDCLQNYFVPVCCFSKPIPVLLLLTGFRTDLFYIVRLRSIPFSLPIAYAYEFCGLLVSVSNSSAIFSFLMCAVNMSRTHSSSLSPQSALGANSTRSA